MKAALRNSADLWAPGIIGFVALIAALWARKRAKRAIGNTRRAFLLGAVLATVLMIVVGLWGAAVWWYAHRPQPRGATRRLFEGITYTRVVKRTPRPMVITIITVDLKARGIRFLVTPPDRTEGRMLRARKTSTFIRTYSVQVAINANYFFPFRTKTPFDYYPHEGDPVDVIGIAASRGDVYSKKPWEPGTLYLSDRNEASFDRPTGEVYNAVSGNGFVLKEGQVAGPFPPGAYPRAGLALSRDATRLILVTVDGKQPNYSEGATLEELAEILRRHGGFTGIRLDEGGSTTLAAEGPDGEPVLLNRPVDLSIPGRERVVANHLGILARP